MPISIRYSPILETTGDGVFFKNVALICYIFGPSVVKYGILTNFEATTTLGAMANKIFVLAT